MNCLSVSKKFLPLHPQSRNKHWFERAKSRNATTGWPVRLSVRTQDFHSWKGGSIPPRATSKKNKELKNRLVEMANHKSSLKRIRQEETRRLHNRYYGKTMRNAVRKLRATTDKTEAVAMYPGITKMLDKLAKTNVIHKNKANNLKSKLALYINKLA